MMYPEAWHDHWGGKPLYPIDKPHLNSLIINISTHFPLKMGRNTARAWIQFDHMITIKGDHPGATACPPLCSS